jgi:site-specific DNA-methyltransferase (adenine-specific)
MEKTELKDATIIHGDSRQVLSDIADSSIDCVITDPPYFIDGMGDEWSNEKLRKSRSKAAAIGGLPVGMKFDPKQGRELQEFMSQISHEVYRILKPGGFYLSFSQGRLYHRMAVAIEDAGFEVRDMLIWSREGQAKAFSQDHFVKKMKIPDAEKETILASLKGRKTPQLKGQSEPIVLAQKPKEGTFVQNWIKYGVGLVDVTQSLDGKFPGTVMEVPKPKGEERAESKHLTLKPVRLMEHLIRVFTKEGDIVLDPFSGSGSTGVAALQTGRRYVGIELSDEFYLESVDRLVKRETSGEVIGGIYR